jgi:large subunit ribosomal protein L1
MANGKRTVKAREGIDREKLYPLDEAVKMIKERAKAKFDETIEIAMNLGVDPRHADQMVRGVVALPNGTGRTTRVAVFARGVKADEARAAGADVVGAEDLVEKVNAGNIDFDRCIATPDPMPLVGRLARCWSARHDANQGGHRDHGCRQRREGSKGGSVEFRVGRPASSAGVGKASFTADKLAENAQAFADAVQKAKPPAPRATSSTALRVFDDGPRREDRTGDVLAAGSTAH